MIFTTRSRESIKTKELNPFYACIKKHMKFIVLAISMLTTISAYSNPSFNSVTSGNVSVSQSAHSTVVTERSQQAILRWNSFNIGAHEKTQFIQPNRQSVVLNRVIPSQGGPQGASQIYGSLTSNGQIILINGAGIHFGPSSTVNVGGLIASTTDISNTNFLAGKYIFNIPSSAASDAVINEGHITAANNGLVALLGSNVVNSGVIQARQGSIVLGTGSEFTLDFSGDQLVNFVVNKAASHGGTIKNSGTLLADGGQILVTAKAAQGVLDNVIDMGGITEANSVAEKGGVIILSSSGEVTVSGKVVASGVKKNTRGGTIKVLGQNVHLTSTATLDADGNLGGGEILVGGNEHGAGPEQNALATIVDAGALLSANALAQGNGGKVIVWSNNATYFHGSISATGGSSGNGGFVETSGHYLDVSDAKINLLAAHGRTGTWLLDPADLTICDSCTTTTTNSGNTFNDNGTNSYLLVSDLTTALNTANVTLQTTTNGIGGNGDIFVNAALNWTSSSTLSLSAVNRIFLNADITAPHGGLILSAANIPQSITSGSEATLSSTGVTANIAANSFNLGQGQWYQVSSSLPNFSATNDFEMNTGSGSVQFIRALGGSGASNSPYVLTDIYGVQGINSNSATLGFSYQVANDIDASMTSTWNNSTGFTPIGNNTNNFAGTFDGQNHSINNYFSTQNGLFAITSSSAGIENIGMNNATLTLTNMAQGSFGSLVGNNYGTISNAYSSGSISNSDSAGNDIFGGLVGQNNGSISSSYSASNVSNNDSGGAEIFGSLLGQNNNASLTTSHSSGSVTNIDNNGFEIMGGLLGQNNGSAILSASYSTSNVSNNDSGSGFEIFGSLLGQNNGSVDTSYSSGIVSNQNTTGGFEIFGGLLGQNNGSLTTSYSSSNISNSDSQGFEVFGGLAGQNNVSISNSYNISNITNADAGGFEIFGGLVGQNNNSIDTAYTISNVSNNEQSAGTENFGGLVGMNFGSIHASYSNSSVLNNENGNGSEIFGGLVGFNFGSVTGTYSRGSVTNIDSNGSESFGGLVGSNVSSISDSYSTSNVANNDNTGFEILGGLVGINFGGSVINNVYSTGYVRNSSGTAGGLLGFNGGTLTNGFWDIDTSGVSTSAAGIGEHTATMMLQNTYCPSGNCNGNANYFDFANTWGIVPGDGINPNGSYPYLLALDPTPRVLSGFIPGGSASATGLAGTTVMLGVGGSNIDSVSTGNNGFYYFLEQNIADNTPFIAYLSGSTTKSNIVSNTPTHGASLTMLNMTSHDILIGGGTENLAGVLTVDPATTISNSDLSSATTGLDTNDILFTVSGNNVTLSNSSGINTNLQTDSLGYSNTTYNINGTISSTSTETDTLNFYGSVIVNSNSVSTTGDQTFHNTVNINTDTIINSQNGSLSFANVNGNSAISLLANNGSITLNGNITTSSNAQNALVLVDGVSFINHAGSNALSASNSRYLIYSANPANDTLDGLTPNDKYYHSSYAVNSPGSLSDQTENTVLYTIAPVLTITANNTTSTYNSSPIFTYSVTGLVDGDTTSVLSGDPNYMLPAALADLHVTGSPYSITVGTGSLTSHNDNYGFVFNNGSLTVTPASLTVTAVGQNKVYDATTTASVTLSSTNNAATDGVSVSYGSANFSDKNVGINKTVTVNNISLSGTNSADFTLQNTSALTEANITPFALTVNASAQNKVYDSTTNANASISSNSFAGDNVSLNYSSAAFSDKNVGTGKTVSVNGIALSGTDANNYALNSTVATTTANITPAALTIMANNQSKTYGQTLNLGTTAFTAQGLQGSDTINSVALTSLGASSNAQVANSPYLITPSSATGSNFISTNYTINYATGNLTVTPASLSVIANNQNISYGQTYSPTAVSYVGFINGDTVSSLNTASTVSATPSSDGQFHATNPGTNGGPTTNSPFSPYLLTPSKVSDSNYNINYVNGGLFVSPSELNFNVPTGTHNVTVNMSSGTPTTISGHSNLATEQLQFVVDGTIAKTSAFLVSDIADATITTHATNTTLGTLAGLQINPTDTLTHTMTLSQNMTAANADSTNRMTPDTTLVPVIFGDPTTALTLQGNGKNTVININSLDTNFTGTLTANTKGGTSDIINFNGISAAKPNTISLTGSTINLNGDINLPNTNLNLSATSAASNAKSITSSNNSVGVTANINVNNFNLIQGGWYQDNNTLPTFTVANNFQLTGIPNASVQFIRATSGAGTNTNPYVLTDIYGVEGIGSNSTTLGYSYLLGNNVNGAVTSHWNNGIGFIAIGNYTNNFIGAFNGQNYTVSNLYINNATLNNPAGLFGVTNNSSISNVSVSGSFTGQTYAAGLIGLAQNTTVSNARVLAGSVVTSLYSSDVGGLIGLNVGGALSNVSSSATVLGLASTSSIGGLIGYNNGGSVSQAISNGTVSSGNGTQNIFIGGLIGINTGSVSNSSSAVTLNAANSSTNSNTAGFISYNAGTVTGSSSNSIVTAGNNSYDADLAGFIAINTGSVNSSTNYGAVTAGSNSRNGNIAGFIADNYGSVANSSNQGVVTLGNNGNYGYVAGFVAENDIVVNYNTVTSLSSITNSYNTGSVVGGNGTSHQSIAGLVAMNYGNISNSSNQGGFISGNNTSQSGDMAGLVADSSATIVNGSLVGGNITNSYNSGAVSGDNYSNQGNMAGLVAVNNGGTITNSYNSGSVTGGNNSTYGDIGGLVADNMTLTINSRNGGGGDDGGSGGGSCGNNNNYNYSSSTVAGGNITGSYNTGLISGGNLSNQGNISGLVAINNGSVTSSYNSGAVTGGSGAINGSVITYSTNGNIGGLVAVNSGSITNSYNSSTGTVTGANYASHGDLGGLVAVNTSTINNSYNLGAVTGGNYSNHGNIAGLVATNSGSITNSYNSANVTGGNNSQQMYIGGLVGYNTGNISYSYNYGTIQAGNYISGLDIGGLAGFNAGLISNSINYGNVLNGKFNTNVNISGIAGLNQGTVVNSSNKGTVSK